MNRMTRGIFDDVKAWWKAREKWQKIMITLGGLCLLISLVAGAATCGSC